MAAARARGRPTALKSPRDAILLVCEGRESEPGYFRRLRALYGLTNVRVVAGNAATDYGSVLRRTEELCARIETCDFAYAVCDGDSMRIPVEPERRIRTGTPRRQAILRSAITMPCFEYWLLLHFEYTDAAHTCSGALDRLMRSHWPTYAKRDDIFDKINREHVEQARANARRLAASGASDVSTDLGALLDSILE